MVAVMAAGFLMVIKICVLLDDNHLLYITP
jgi:hypothetical protein